MILDIVNTLFELFWVLLKWPLIILMIFVIVMFILVLAWTFYYRVFKKIQPIEGEHYKVKQPNIFVKLFWLAPKQLALDRLRRNPEFFRHQGLIIYTGNQGSGKTSTMVHDLMMMQEEYPKMKSITNFGFKNENDELKHWKQLVNYKNDIQGVAVGIDEIQNWFNSKQSKNFPPEMLQIVTTNRKNRRVICGSCQRFYMVSKDIRTQCSEVRHCHTFGGVFTVVIRKTPIVDSEGEVKEERFKGIYCWVHDEKTREAYDTYKMIDVLGKEGFKEESEQYRLQPPKQDIIVNIDNKKQNKK